MTMKIETIDRATCRILGEAVDEALRPVAEKFGLAFRRESGRFTDASFTVKGTFSVRGEGGVPKDAARHAGLLGLPEDCVGKQFMANGSIYTVEGVNIRRPKFPVSGRGIQGGRYKFTVAQVLAGLL